MLDQIDLTRIVMPDEYRQRMPVIQERLLSLEQALADARVPVIVVFEGWAGTSKIGTIGQITRRLDPRNMRVYSITPPRTSETQYPWLYRFWLKLPSYGQIAIFDRSWYREVLAARTREGLNLPSFHSRCEDIAAFERQLADDGAVILKFWLHISRKEQDRRFHKLLKSRFTAWQVTEDDRWQQRHYNEVRTVAEDLISRTDTPYAPWIVLPATDPRYVHLTVSETLMRALESTPRLVAALTPASVTNGSSIANDLLVVNGEPTVLFDPSGIPQTSTKNEQPPALAQPDLGILQRVDLSQRIDEKTYERRLARQQAKLGLLGFEIYRQRRPVIVIFEGWDAAGKGGVIQRITAALDPRGYVVHAIAAPAGDDAYRHYLYRFWRRLPPAGGMAIFDRSWYGRVLVERVEGFARVEQWQRAYAEINEFERQLIAAGTIMCKFWLHISPEEQLRRFQERQSVRHKAWKLTEEDWRNRARWADYERAADEMVLRTSTPRAPWTIIEADDKRFARVKILRTLVHRLEADLGKVKL